VLLPPGKRQLLIITIDDSFSVAEHRRIDTDWVVSSEVVGIEHAILGGSHSLGVNTLTDASSSSMTQKSGRLDSCWSRVASGRCRQWGNV